MNAIVGEVNLVKLVVNAVHNNLHKIMKCFTMLFSVLNGLLNGCEVEVGESLGICGPNLSQYG